MRNQSSSHSAAGGSRRGSGLMLPIVVTEIAVVLVLWLIAPYLKSHMEISKEDIDQQIEEVKKRAAEREKREHLEREKRVLKKEDAERLKKEERERRERKIRDKVEDMQQITRRMYELRQEKLEQLRKRQQEELVARLTRELQREVEQLQQQAEYVYDKSWLAPALELSKQADELKQQADATVEQPSQDVEHMQALATQAQATAQQLLQEQREAHASSDKRRRRQAGNENETIKAAVQLERVQAALDKLAKAKVEEYNDTSILDQLEQLAQASEAGESPSGESGEAGESGQSGQSGESGQSGQSQSGEPGQSQSQGSQQAKSGKPGQGRSRRPGQRQGPQLGNPQQMNMQQLYDSASQLEQQVAEDFAVVRAAELSMLQGQKFSDAFATISQNLPQQMPMDFSALGQQVSTIGQLNQFRAQLDQAVQTANQMWQNSRNMQTQAEGLAPSNKEQPGQLSKDQLAALQHARKDVTEAAQMLQASGTTLDLSTLMRRAYGSVSDHTEQRDETAEGGDEMMAKVVELQAILDTEKIRAEAMPGRRFTDESERAGWLYIDTWYVIGPWENHGRIDWDVLHPPEWEVDLARTYTDGKEGRELSWQFTQSNVMRCTPPDEQPDGTYYCYTEAFFDRDRDMLLAIASDDAAKVWVNDILVWQDSGLSSWSLDEGFRKVAFNQGFNRILVRLENGPLECQYSLLLCPSGLD